jgi:hypothetical protein
MVELLEKDIINLEENEDDVEWFATEQERDQSFKENENE